MKPLKIALVGPLSKTSSIAMNGVHIAKELARRGHQLTMIRSELGESAQSAPRDVPFEVRMLTDMADAHLINDFDVILAQFGDNYRYHGALMNRLGTLPVVGILHDSTIPNLVFQWVFDEADGDDAGFKRIAEIGADLYGDDAIRDICWTEPMGYATALPMLELVSDQLDAAVVHADHYRERVSKSGRLPVAVIPLVADDLSFPEMPVAHPGKMTVGVIGNVNSNKRIDQLLLAIGASGALRHSITVKVVGHAEQAQADKLRAMARALGIAPPVFTGWVDDERMSAEIADIDVISCLRFPVLEGASGSLVLALRSGRPTLVSRHASYAETPDDMALFCAPGNEAHDVLLHLEMLFADPDHGRDIGARAREWATKRHSVESYVDRLEPFLYEYTRHRPVANARAVMEQIFEQVGVDRDDPAVARSHHALTQLVG